LLQLKFTDLTADFANQSFDKEHFNVSVVPQALKGDICGAAT